MSKAKCDKPLGLAFLVSLLIASGSASAQNLKDSIESFSIWHDAKLEAKGLVRAELKAKKLEKEPVLVINNQKVLFNDSGINGDARAGDGVYSALVNMPIKEFLAEKFAGKQIDFGTIAKELLNAPNFEGRAVVKDEAKIKQISSLTDPAVQRRVQTLRALAPSLSRSSLSDAFKNLGLNPSTTPVLRVQPRPNRSSLVSFFDTPEESVIQILPSHINAANSLMITDVRVVEDPTRTFDICKPAGLQGNPKGVWTFGHLMRQLASGTGLTPESYALQWLNTWASNQTINAFLVPSRPNVSSIISTWQAASPGGVLNVDYFPARLMAIVNRPDIGLGVSGGFSGYGGGGGVVRGEARLVFALLSKTQSPWGGTKPIVSDPYTLVSNSNNLSKVNLIDSGDFWGKPSPKCGTVPFTVIFEYNTPTKTCRSVQNWQRRWRDLSQYALGSSTYNSQLAAITTSFTSPTNNSELPNRSWLAQLRTNENHLAQPWELREFVVADTEALVDNSAGSLWANTGKLFPDTVKDTPKERPFTSTPLNTANGATFNNTNFLKAFVENFWAPLPPEERTVPLTMPAVNPWLSLKPPAIPVTSQGIHIRAGSSFVTDNNARNTASPAGYHWNYTISPTELNVSLKRKLRRDFSLATCNGCHAGETQTFFTHIGDLTISPTNNGELRSIGQEAKLSKFLTGKSSVEALNSPNTYDFLAKFISHDPVTANGVIKEFNDIAQRRDVMENILNLSKFECPDSSISLLPLELFPIATHKMPH